MSDKKIWFRPDKDYDMKVTDWICTSPTMSGWYDTQPRTWANSGRTLEGILLPYVERRWFDVYTGTWSSSCMVGDPDDFEQAVKKVGRKTWRALWWRGLREKPDYPPDYN